MKPSNIILASIIFLVSVSANSQIRINLFDGTNLSGFYFGNTKDSLSIKTIDKLKISVHQKSIIKIDSLYSTIILQDGKTDTGYISKMTDEDLTLKIKNGKENIFQLLDVREIQIEGNQDNHIQTVANNQSQFSDRSSYFEAGLTIGTPGGLNLLFGYISGIIGFRAEIGTIPIPSDFDGHYNFIGFGAQANLMFNLNKSETFEQNVSLWVGYSDWYPRRITYFGPSIDINYHKYFLEIGLVFGAGLYSNPQLMMQFGIVLR